jgi:hypothetical protein
VSDPPNRHGAGQRGGFCKQACLSGFDNIQVLSAGLALDSETAFASRLVGLVLATYRGRSAGTGMGDCRELCFFSCSYAPGGIDETSFVEVVVVPVLGNAAHPLKASFKSLLFESYTLMVSDMKRKIERVEDDRLSVYQPQRGLHLSGEYECAHSLIDNAVQMLKMM